MLETIDKTVIAAAIGAFAGGLLPALGWFVGHRLALRRDEHNRRLHARREYLEAQIRTLYGPLLGLVRRSRHIYEVARKRLPTNQNRIEMERFSETDSRVWSLFIDKYFLPINAEVTDLILRNQHLVGDTEASDAMQQFLAHAAQFDVLYRLWKEAGVSSIDIAGIGFPPSLEEDVRRTLDVLLEGHRESLDGIVRLQ